MRCEKMHATMTMDQCIRNQDAKAGIPGLVRFSGPKYMMCQDCAQGLAARNGLLNDDDVEKLKEDEMARKRLETVEVDPLHGREACVNGAGDVGEDGTYAPEIDALLPAIGDAPATKRCAKCGEWKPANEFHVDRHSATGLTSYCKICNRTAKRERMREIREERNASKEAALMEAEANEPMKRCTKCGEEKPLSRFSTDGTGKPGRLRSICKECNARYVREYAERKKREALEAERTTASADQAGAVTRPTEMEQGTPGLIVPILVPDETQRPNNSMTQRPNDPTTQRPDDPTTLLIDFHRHRELLARIRTVADDEERTPESQVLYWLKKHVQAA